MSELPTAVVLAACVLVISCGALVLAQLDDPEPRRTPAAESAPDGQEGYEVPTRP